MPDAIKIMPKMSEEDRKALEDQIKEDELILANPDGLATAKSIDSREMKASIQRKKDALGKDEELIAKGDERDKVHLRIKELETMLKDKMPTHNEMWQKMGTNESNDAVRKNMYFHQKYAREIQELVSLRRRLEPQDPSAGSLERIRPA